MSRNQVSQMLAVPEIHRQLRAIRGFLASLETLSCRIRVSVSGHLNGGSPSCCLLFKQVLSELFIEPLCALAVREFEYVYSVDNAEILFVTWGSRWPAIRVCGCPLSSPLPKYEQDRYEAYQGFFALRLPTLSS